VSQPQEPSIQSVSRANSSDISVIKVSPPSVAAKASPLPAQCRRGRGEKRRRASRTPVTGEQASLVCVKTGDFDPQKIQDQYEDAVKELLKKKRHGENIEAPKERKPANVVNLMEALRRRALRLLILAAAPRISFARSRSFVILVSGISHSSEVIVSVPPPEETALISGSSAAGL
jgi:hypothetical protein